MDRSSAVLTDVRLIRILAFSMTVAALLGTAGTSCAFTLEELRKFDKDGSGSINTPAELRVYNIHKYNPIFATHDINGNGLLEVNEVRAIEAEALATAQDEGFAQGAIDANNIALGKPIRLVDLAEKPKPPPDPESKGKPPSCLQSDQDLFVRRDRLDTGIYAGDVAKQNSKGASAAFLHDEQNSNDTATIDAAITYIFVREPCLDAPAGLEPGSTYLSAYGLAGWVVGAGNLSDSPSLDKSSLRIGMNGEFELFSGPVFNNQNFQFGGYFQTDYRGEASAYGATASWQPMLIDAALGFYRPDAPYRNYIDFYWTAVAELDALHVDNAGLTNLAPGTDYVWLGGTLQLKLLIFKEYFESQLYATLSYKYYLDAVSDRDIDLFSAELAYNLTEDGSTSVSFEYQQGTVKSTLEDVEQYLVRLNYKY